MKYNNEFLLVYMTIKQETKGLFIQYLEIILFFG